MALYLGTLYLQTLRALGLDLLVQLVLLTTVQGVVMVAGAIVISSHSTTVRAANLLASAIIIPMALFLQVESVLIFWGYAGALWYMLALLVVIAFILVRMGLATFNREAILTREIDELDVRRLTAQFRWRLLGRDGFSLRRIYARDLPELLQQNRLPLGLSVAVGLGALALGAYLAVQYPLPGGTVVPGRGAAALAQATQAPDLGVLPGLDAGGLFFHNARTLLLEAGLSIFTFGSGALVILMAPLALIGFFTGEVAQAGVNPLLFLAAFILPHGIVEIPAATLAATFALRLGAVVMSPSDSGSAGEHFVQALADWVKVFVFLVVPLLLVAAVVEAHLTPYLVALVFGG